MNRNLSLKIFSIAACLALSGCLNASQNDAAGEERIKFVNITSHSVAKAAEFSEEDLAAQCPKLAKLSEDVGEAMADGSDEWPESFQDFIDCFELPDQPTEEDFEEFGDRLAEDPTKFLDCICGSSALSDAWKGRAFSAELSGAASSYFSASTSSGSKGSFDAGKSGGSSTKFDASRSSGAGGQFGD
jgi:hypothetical protein